MIGKANSPTNTQIKALIKLLNVLMSSEIYFKDEAFIHLKVFCFGSPYLFKRKGKTPELKKQIMTTLANENNHSVFLE